MISIMLQPPIKKTNVILKNVNFQYAAKLWEYIHKYMGKKDEPIKKSRDYMDNSNLKNLIDESFLLEYLTLSNIDSDEKQMQEARDKTISKMLDRIIDLNPDLTKKEIQEKLGLEYDRVKLKRIRTKKDIEKIFRKHIDKYFAR